MENIEINIIPATAAYLDAAVEIALEAWKPIKNEYLERLGQETYEGYFGNWEKDKRSEVIKGLMGGHGFVTLIDGEIAGFISYSVDPFRLTGTIHDNAVSGKFRGREIGTKQYLFVQEDMRKLGLKYVDVETGLGYAMEPARKAYAKAGFSAGLPNIHFYKTL